MEKSNENTYSMGETICKLKVPQPLVMGMMESRYLHYYTDDDGQLRIRQSDVHKMKRALALFPLLFEGVITYTTNKERAKEIFKKPSKRPDDAPKFEWQYEEPADSDKRPDSDENDGSSNERKEGKCYARA